MPRKPCMICRTTVSTPAKFLLQCSCGIGLHHNCIVPAIPKRTLMSMIEASTNDHHANSLKSWKCPGCKVDDHIMQCPPVVKNKERKKKKPRLNAREGPNFASSSRLRLDQLPKNDPPPKKRVRDAAADRTLMDAIPVIKAPQRIRKEETPLASRRHDPQLSPIESHNLHHPQSKYEKNLLAVFYTLSTNKDDCETVRPPPKLLRADDNHIGIRPTSTPVLKGKETATHPQLKSASIPIRPVSQSSKLPVSENNIIPTATLPSEKIRQSPPKPPQPPPPLLDLRKLLKRKRCDSHHAFQKKRLYVDHDNVPLPVEPTIKKRRLNTNEPETTQKPSHPQFQALPEAKRKDTVVDSPALVEESATQPVEKPPPTPKPHTPNSCLILQSSSTKLPLPITELGQTAKHGSPEDIQIHNPSSNPESTACSGNPEPSNDNSSSNTLPRPSEEALRDHAIADISSPAEDVLLNAPGPEGPTAERATSAIDSSEQIEPSTPVNEVYPVKEYAMDGTTEAAHHQKSDAMSNVSERLEADRSRTSKEVGQATEMPVDEESPIIATSSNSNSTGDACKRTQEMSSFVDGLLSPPLTDPDDGHVDLLTAESPVLDSNRVQASSETADRACTDKMSIADAEQSHATTNKTATETDLDRIVKLLPLPRPQPRSSFQLPRVTLPILAQYFRPFKNTMKNAGVAL